MQETSRTESQAAKKESPSGPFVLPKLPFDEGALAPVISARTSRFHYGKHHKAYVDKLNELVRGTDYTDMPLDEVVRATAGDRTKQKIFNNAAQAWNHNFYWQCLAQGQEPSAGLGAAIRRDFGGLDALKQRIEEVAVERFASGWAWLVVDGGKLSVIDTMNADTPMAHDKTCLLTVDVWEHAYYLDYQNKRDAHVKAVVENLLNWTFASQNFERAAD